MSPPAVSAGSAADEAPARARRPVEPSRSDKLRAVFDRVLRALRPSHEPTPGVRWLKHGGWFAAELPSRMPAAPHKELIETTAASTDQLGPQPLASHYGEVGGTRTPSNVRSSSRAGDFYAWLAKNRRPDIIVEFGAAFGVSGMYFVAGLEAAQSGRLYSFEINDGWADIAERNIKLVSPRVTLTRGAYEDNRQVIPAPIDIAFVDGIHTYEFVIRQHALLRPSMAPNAIMMFDDIDFVGEHSRMREAWDVIWQDADVIAAFEFYGRLGVVQLR